jgi:hypothetical protein
MLPSFAKVILRIRNTVPATSTATTAIRGMLRVVRVAGILIVQLLLLLLLLVVPVFLRLATVLLLLLVRARPVVALFRFLLLLRKC